MNSVSRFVIRPAAERALLVRATFALIAVRLGLWLAPSGVVRRAVEGGGPTAESADTYDERAVLDAARAVRAASRFVPRATCLTQALALLGVLRRTRQPVVLRIGVRRNERALEAHAWVECGGRVILGRTRDLGLYTALERAGAPAAR